VSGAFFLAAALLAFVCALADSALLAARLHAGAELAVPSTEPLPRREADRQALVFGRVLAQLGAGAAYARWADLSHFSFMQSVGLALLGAALAVAVTEAAARELGDALAERAVRALAPFVRLLATVLAPFVALTLRLDASLRRAVPAPAAAEAAREETAEQFRQVVASEADVTRDEQAILAGVFSLGDTLVHEIMVPRVDVVAVDRETPWADVVARVRSSEHSRLPVFSDTIDEVVGVLYAKDLLPSVIDDEPPAGGWTSLVKPATFIPTTKRVDDQLRDFRASGSHMAVVVDEYGGTAGIVTIEDVLEEIVGEIRDEHDEVEQPPIESEGDARFWVEGRVTLDELSDTVGEDLRMDDVSTVGGLVYELLGRVPRAGESLTYCGFRVVVERVVRRQVRRVYFERLERPASQNGEGEEDET
jgi:putative hemolysin